MKGTSMPDRHRSPFLWVLKIGKLVAEGWKPQNNAKHHNKMQLSVDTTCIMMYLSAGKPSVVVIGL